MKKIILYVVATVIVISSIILFFTRKDNAKANQPALTGRLIKMEKQGNDYRYFFKVTNTSEDRAIHKLEINLISAVDQQIMFQKFNLTKPIQPLDSIDLQVDCPVGSRETAGLYGVDHFDFREDK